MFLRWLFILRFCSFVVVANDHGAFSAHPPQNGTEIGPFTEAGYTLWTTQGKGQFVLHVRSSKDLESYRQYNVDCPLEVLPKGVPLFHWANQNQDELSREVEETLGALQTKDRLLAKKIHEKYHNREGYYVSTDPVDSHDYGNHLFVDIPDIDVPIINPRTCRGVITDDDFVELEKAAPDVLSRLGVMGSRQWNIYDWIVLFDRRAVSSLREVKGDEFLSDSFLGRRQRSLRELLKIDEDYPSQPMGGSRLIILRSNISFGRNRSRSKIMIF